MTNKLTANLLLFALFGIALWFFGNLYEGIVIAPNMLLDSIQKVKDWQDFFVITNPAIFYVPITPIAVLIIIILYAKSKGDITILKKHLKRATIFGLLALVLGIFIITQINFKLFFGDIQKYSKDLYKLALFWNILNMVRVALLTVTLFHTFKAYIWIKQNQFNNPHNKDLF
jgi:hypothetical protein